MDPHTIVQWQPPRSITLWQLVRVILEGAAACFAIGAVIGLIVAVAP